MNKVVPDSNKALVSEEQAENNYLVLGIIATVPVKEKKRTKLRNRIPIEVKFMEKPVILLGYNQYVYYNYFIEQYNKLFICDENNFLSKIPASRIFFQPKWYYMIITIIFCFVPFIWFLMFIIGYIRFTCSLITRHIVNLHKLMLINPFENMIKVPENYKFEFKKSFRHLC